MNFRFLNGRLEQQAGVFQVPEQQGLNNRLYFRFLKIRLEQFRLLYFRFLNNMLVFQVPEQQAAGCGLPAAASAIGRAPAPAGGHTP